MNKYFKNLETYPDEKLRGKPKGIKQVLEE